MSLPTGARKDRKLPDSAARYLLIIQVPSITIIEKKERKRPNVPSFLWIIGYIAELSRYVLSKKKILRVTVRRTESPRRRLAATSSNKRNETGNCRRVYFGNEGSGNRGRGGVGARGRQEGAVVKFRSGSLLQGWNSIYRERRGTNGRVRRIIRRLYSRNDRSEFRVSRFAADTSSDV